MLAEFLEAWKNEVTAALLPTITPFDRSQDRLVTKPGGETEVVKGDRANLKHLAGNLDTVKKLVKSHSDIDPAVEVWHNRAGVAIIFDPLTYRRDRAHMTLDLSDEIKTLMEIGGKNFQQPAIISLLRIKFKVCNFANLIQALRSVKFEINESGEQTIERTKVSMGKSQMAKLFGLDALQESIDFTIPVFQTKFRQYFTVSAALDPDPQTKTFSIIPYPGQIEAAIEAAELALGLELEGLLPEGTPIYFGTP